MTNEELINKFPEHRLIKRSDIKPVLEEIFLTTKTYHEVRPRIMKKCKELFPRPNGFLRFDGLTDKDWKDYFWGRYNDKFEKVDDSFNDWVELVEEEVVSRKGKLHTFEDACHIAASKWCEMCFGNHIQDNGDRSETGLWCNMLATIVADKNREGITENTIENVHKNLYEYYKDGCLYQWEDGHKTFCEPYCDYNPNLPLSEALEKAGLSKTVIRCICPIKTGISIDKKDNSVIVRGYQKENYF